MCLWILFCLYRRWAACPIIHTWDVHWRLLGTHGELKVPTTSLFRDFGDFSSFGHSVGWILNSNLCLLSLKQIGILTTSNEGDWSNLKTVCRQIRACELLWSHVFMLSKPEGKEWWIYLQGRTGLPEMPAAVSSLITMLHCGSIAL